MQESWKERLDRQQHPSVSQLSVLHKYVSTTSCYGLYKQATQSYVGCEEEHSRLDVFEDTLACLCKAQCHVAGLADLRKLIVIKFHPTCVSPCCMSTMSYPCVVEAVTVTTMMVACAKTVDRSTFSLGSLPNSYSCHS